mmetsp:Transcript_19400/g.33206  ORF Transcript_19400/g.33206 Transcript_19400/m.33206 type:complete len:94 (+) Transcript_19400:1253-1534(+)
MVKAGGFDGRSVVEIGLSSNWQVVAADNLVMQERLAETCCCHALQPVDWKAARVGCCLAASCLLRTSDDFCWTVEATMHLGMEQGMKVVKLGG